MKEVTEKKEHEILYSQLQKVSNELLEGGIEPKVIMSVMGNKTVSEYKESSVEVLSGLIEVLMDLKTAFSTKKKTKQVEDKPKREPGRKKKETETPAQAQANLEFPPEGENEQTKESTDNSKEDWYNAAYETLEKLYDREDTKPEVRALLEELYKRKLDKSDAIYIAQAARWANKGKMEELKKLIDSKPSL
jgi:hypothetical protein